MAIVFKENSICPLCGKTLKSDELIISLQAISETTHELYQYFDTGIHQTCFESWDKKEEALTLLKRERQNFEDSEYYKEMYQKFGRPNG